MSTRFTASRGGFTLMEILVALILVGLLVGTLLPSVITQVSKGEINRLNEDLESVSHATKSFRVDVQRWPSDIDDLYSQPVSGDTALTGGAYPAGLAAKWAGPYFEKGTITGDTIPTALGGVILPGFTKTLWGGKNFMTIKVKNVSIDDAWALSARIDGDTITALTDAGARVRWKTGTAGDTLIFLGAPLQ